MTAQTFPTLAEALAEARSQAWSWAGDPCSAARAWRSLAVNARTSVNRPDTVYEAIDDRQCIDDVYALKCIVTLIDRNLEILDQPRWRQTKKQPRLVREFRGLREMAIECAADCQEALDRKEALRSTA